MDAKQKNLVKNIAGAVVLLGVILLGLVYFGAFDSVESDEAQIRELMDRAREETNDHDWDDLFRLGDMTDERREAWQDNVPRQANLVVIDDIRPMEIINVPAGATDYDCEVKVIAHIKNPISGANLQGDVVDGTLYFVKKDERWWIDFDRSADTFRYIRKP